MSSGAPGLLSPWHKREDWQYWCWRPMSTHQRLPLVRRRGNVRKKSRLFVSQWDLTPLCLGIMAPVPCCPVSLGLALWRPPYKKTDFPWANCFSKTIALPSTLGFPWNCGLFHPIRHSHLLAPVRLTWDPVPYDKSLWKCCMGTFTHNHSRYPSPNLMHIPVRENIIKLLAWPL